MQKTSFRFRNTNIFLLLLSLYLAMGCQREVQDAGTTGGNPAGGVNDNITVVAGVRGIVVDENNQPVEGAAITSSGSTTTTDRYGVFRFNNINLSKANGYVKVVKQGYFTGSRSFVTTAGRIHNIRIKLLPKTNSGNFTASTGGTITLSSGAKLMMPGNAVNDASGNPYSGQVNIAMTWIDPSASNLPEIIIGDLRGITTSGEERGLETFGMLGVEMTGSTGQALKIASGKTAELTFPIPASLLGNAPATIDLWHFDEVKGRWIQEGTAIKTGNNYVAQVSHFSFWNCDVPYPLINLSLTAVNAANNQPLVNVLVRIKRTNGSSATGWTDSVGFVSGKVPKNEPLVLEVLSQCNTVVYSQNIGPFGGDANLGIVAVTVPTTNSLTITGNLTNCSNSNVTNGAVLVYTNNAYSYTIPVTNGAFSITIIRCSGTPLNFALKGIDLATLQESSMYNGTGTNGIVNVGTIQACGSLTEFIEYIIDGVPYNWMDMGQPNTVDAYDSVANNGFSTKTGVYAQFVTNGNVEHTYFWFFNNLTPGTYPLLSNLWDANVNDKTGSLNLRNFVTINPMINITTFGPTGTGYIEGSFNAQMNVGPGQAIRNVICNFKVKR
ncbi:MAG TPA: carboxypeptidase regulatory-like domain-containing protein [Chitinophagaceae bacterium]|nr:carboxypeptidase regulatory-like domain-containing protein [Chitinophagaceae bacterium]